MDGKLPAGGKEQGTNRMACPGLEEPGLPVDNPAGVLPPSAKAWVLAV